MQKLKLLFSVLMLMAMASCSQKEEIDLLIIGDAIYNPANNSQLVSAIAVKGEKIIAIGEKEKFLSKYAPAETIDAEGKFICPGFIDAHCHFSGYALNKYICNLVGTTSFEEIINKLVEYDKTNSLSWIYARGWDQNDWEIKEFPTKEKLDKLFPDKPVILKRIDGHAILCNQKALEQAGITKSTVIKGGIVEKKNGRLTGILVDNAAEPVEKLIPMLPEKESIKYLLQAEKECYALGLTGVVDCGVKKEIIELLRTLYKTKKLSIGNTVLLTNETETINFYLKNGPIDESQFRLTGIKLYADGALGSRGACLLQPYADRQNHYGLLLTDTADIKDIAKKAKEYKWQLCTHAIGDSANRTILHIYSGILNNKNNLRWRIEHAQVVAQQDLHYFTDYNIIPSVQPTHATSDMPWAGDRLGQQRLPTAYAYKELLKQNGWIPLGTDFPVEEINPLNTFYAAVVRKDKNGNPKDGFQVENSLTREEALNGMTIWASKSVFNENDKGSLVPGKDADIVILDKNLLTIPEEEILNTSVLYTIVKGKVKYRK